MKERDMTPPVDPNQVLMTGENSFIRLSHDGGKTMSDRLSHWRVLWCPAGAGHALFVQSELTDGQTRIYSDAVAVARWLQATIETLLFPAFADPSTPIVEATFERHGDARASTSEVVRARDEEITLTWSDFIEPFVLTMPPGFNDRPIGVFSTFFPARGAEVAMGGRFTKGHPWPEMRGDRQSSSACLAWSETWVKPKG
jgi:hypothetical protein